MRLRRLFTIFLIIIIAVCSIEVAEASETMSEGETTSQVEAKKKKKKKKKKRRKKKRRKKRRKKRSNTPAPEVAQNDSLTLSVNSAVLKWIPDNINPGGLRINSVKPDKKNKITRVGLNENFTYLPVTMELIDSLSHVVKITLPDSIQDYSISLNVGKRSLSYYITKVDKLPEQYRKNKPFVYPTDPYFNAVKGMQGDIVALWHSHGRYFKPGSGAWMWQRPLLFETVEDIYTMGYILPYVVPMLENAGAYVFLPRERDTNIHEVIVDNDTNEGGMLFSQPYYKELPGTTKWENGELEGFIYDLPDFRDTENPFEGGSYRQTKTIKNGKASVAAWYADIPEDGEYAVYVSYKTLTNSTTDALYTVNYSGGSRSFRVNQTMGGGTWIYLGTFPLEAGYSDTEPVVTLSNVSQKEADKIITADAVKIGGGMGNIARSNHRADLDHDPSTPEVIEIPQVTTVEEAIEDIEEDSENDSTSTEQECEEGSETDEEDETTETDENPEETSEQDSVMQTDTVTTPQPTSSPSGKAPVFSVSKYPRYLEGARYWLHWAGFPETVYSPYHGSDDYKDDYTGRAMWVNYLAGGSRVLPNQMGLNIPVDLAMALHSDAGKRADDSIVGTLGIYYTENGGTYADGTARINSRMLTDMLMRQITGDIRQTIEPDWKRRSMWDKSYVEARVPEVPTSLIELLSHQNFGDMQYGLDPNFRFTVGRAIYKAMARFVAERKDREVVIQPLPVNSFAIVRFDKGRYRLSWKPTKDELEPSAVPTGYVIFERSEGMLGFHKIGETKSTSFDITVKDHDIHSFKVYAINEGGMSFPSEVLALRESKSKHSPVLIINGFTRISGPSHFAEGNNAGFNSEEDFGVPYIRDISFSGHQTEFRRNAGESFGRSDNNYSTKVIAGNTFDFVALHGQAIADADLGFVSASVEAVETGIVNLTHFKIVDLILGKQKETAMGRGIKGYKYKTFSRKLQDAITNFVDNGGDIFISGQYVVSDMFGTRASESDRNFARNVLGYTEADKQKITNPRVVVRSNDLSSEFSLSKYHYCNTLNEDMYIVEFPDIIMPNDQMNAEVLMTFADTDYAATTVMKNGKSKAIVMTVPFESVKDESLRKQLMKEILNYFDK